MTSSVAVFEERYG